MKRNYILLAMLSVFMLSMSYCSTYVYQEDGLTVRYFSKYRIQQGNASLHFDDADMLSKGDSRAYRDVFKVFYTYVGNVSRIEHYKYDVLYTIRYNDRKQGRVVRLEKYSNGTLVGYYINYYNDVLVLVERKFFNAYDELERVEAF